MNSTDSLFPVTIADVAEQAGVSISTVSRVVNGSAPVDDATAEKVRQAVVALGYIPQAAAATWPGVPPTP